MASKGAPKRQQTHKTGKYASQKAGYLKKKQTQLEKHLKLNPNDQNSVDFLARVKKGQVPVPGGK